MSPSSIACALTLCLVALAVDHHPAPNERPDASQRVTLDAVLAAYLGGDTEVVARSFAESRIFPDGLRLNDPRELERWLGSFDRGKALFLLEMARATTRVSPRFAAVVVSAGRRYFEMARGGDPPAPEAVAFARLWHRAGAGPLQAVSDPWRVEEHVRDLDRAARQRRPATWTPGLSSRVRSRRNAPVGINGRRSMSCGTN